MEAKGRVWPWPWLLGADLAGEARGALRTVGLVLAEARRAALAVGGVLGARGEEDVGRRWVSNLRVTARASLSTRRSGRVLSGKKLNLGAATVCAPARWVNWSSTLLVTLRLHCNAHTYTSIANLDRDRIPSYYTVRMSRSITQQRLTYCDQSYTRMSSRTVCHGGVAR